MVYVTHIRRGGGAGHHHITEFKWRNPSTGETGTSTTAAMVDWISKGGDAKVSDGRNTVSVGVVRPDGHQPYLRTHADGKWTDNLLALPTF